MAEVRLFFSALLERVDGSLLSVGDLRVPIVLTGLNGDISDVTYILDAAGTRIVYDAGETLLGDAAWAFAILIPDDDEIDLELTTDLDGSAGSKELSTVRLRKDVPYILASRASYSGYAENFAAGALDSIERLRVKNSNSDGATHRVRVFLAR